VVGLHKERAESPLAGLRSFALVTRKGATAVWIALSVALVRIILEIGAVGPSFPPVAAPTVLFFWGSLLVFADEVGQGSIHRI
jgi:uncharacterized membrane protein (DUF4010 family)